MLYLVIFFFVVCWIIIFVDLKRTPLHVYETGKYPIVKKTGQFTNIKIKEEEVPGISDPISIDKIIKEKEQEKKELEVA